MFSRINRFFCRQSDIPDGTIDLIVERVLQRMVAQSQPNNGFSSPDRSPQLYKVIDYLETHPEHVNLKLRELQMLTGVSRTYITRARRQYLVMQKQKQES